MRFLFLLWIFFATPAFSQEADSVYTIVDVPAEFPGGNVELMKWFRQNLRGVPDSVNVEEMCIRIQLQFIVEADGRITEMKTVRSHTPEFDAYILRVFAGMPNWEPALLNGNRVRSQVRLPVGIRLDN
jgi:periplasmic protein TonB